MKTNTWSQIKRLRVNGFGVKGSKNPGVKSQAHLERIARRKVSRNARKQQGQANTFADKPS